MVDPYTRNVDETTKAKVEEIGTKDTNNRSSPGSNQEGEKNANLGPLGNGEQCEEDADETAKEM